MTIEHVVLMLPYLVFLSATHHRLSQWRHQHPHWRQEWASLAWLHSRIRPMTVTDYEPQTNIYLFVWFTNYGVIDSNQFVFERKLNEWANSCLWSVSSRGRRFVVCGQSVQYDLYGSIIITCNVCTTVWLTMKLPSIASLLKKLCTCNLKWYNIYLKFTCSLIW